MGGKWLGLTFDLGGFGSGCLGQEGLDSGLVMVPTGALTILPPRGM